MSDQPIIVVAGCARSGTTLMMSILQAAGIPVVVDSNASMEFGKVCSLPDEYAWMEDIRGKAVKIIDPKNWPPPAHLPIRWIWMHRNPLEQAKSQLKFLRATFPNGAPPIDLHRLLASIARDNIGVPTWLENTPGWTVHRVAFENLLLAPHVVIEDLGRFLDRFFDVGELAKLIIDRPTSCAPDLSIELARIKKEDDSKVGEVTGGA